MAKKFRYNMNYSANNFKVNNHALYKKSVGFFYRTQQSLESKDACIVLYIFGMYEKKKGNLSVPENANMNSIVDCLATKYNIINDTTITEEKRQNLLAKYQNRIEEIYTTLEPSICEIYLKNMSNNQK